MYAQVIPHLVHNIEALSAMLKKVEAQCDARKYDKSVILLARLFPDMFALTRQVQLVTDFAKGCGARLSETANPAYADDETTFEGLQARLAKTVSFLNSIDVKKFDGSAERLVTVKIRGEERKLTGHDYVYSYVYPHFYFHMTTTYNILRHNGFELGKADFLGRA